MAEDPAREGTGHDDEDGRSDATADRESGAAHDAPASRSSREEPLADVASRVRERTEDHDVDRPPREGPLADVATEIDERRRRDRDAERTGSDPFESVEVGDLDGEQLWEDLASGEDSAVEGSVTVTADEAEIADDAGFESRDVRTIPKTTCQGCPYVGDPPALHCTHDGTDILAMVDTDHFRVADCPMVVDDDVAVQIADDDASDADVVDAAEPSDLAPSDATDESEVVDPDEETASDDADDGPPVETVASEETVEAGEHPDDSV